MNYPNGPTIKVQITHEDGTVRTLTGDKAKEWGEVVAGMSLFCDVHGVTCPQFAWEETRASEAEAGKT
jgi:hypothetical protein